MIPDCTEQVQKVADEAKKLAIENNCSEIQPIHLFVSLMTKSKIGEELFSDQSIDFQALLEKMQTSNDSGDSSEIDFSISSKQLINTARSFCVTIDFDELNCFGLLIGTLSSRGLVPVLMENGFDLKEAMEKANSKGKDYINSIS